MTGLGPLPLDRDHWRKRWLVTARGMVLHRISQIEWQNDDMIAGPGKSVCGMAGKFQVPGIWSREALARCPECCRALGIPDGNGAPFNVLDGDQADA